MSKTSEQATINFFFESPATVRDRNALRSFIKQTFSREKTKLLSLNYIFCSDKQLLEINRTYLQHDYYTDIITFDLSESQQAPKQAEIYISVERVKDNAQQLGVSFTKELHRVIFHGVLHLCGYKDKTPQQAKEMRQKEEEVLVKYFGKS